MLNLYLVITLAILSFKPVHSSGYTLLIGSRIIYDVVLLPHADSVKESYCLDKSFILFIGYIIFRFIFFAEKCNTVEVTVYSTQGRI